MEFEGFMVIGYVGWYCLIVIDTNAVAVLNPQLWPPRCHTRVAPKEKRRFLARLAQETEQRRALFNAEIDAEAIKVTF